ncbi:MAG: acyltransferase 3 [Enterovirga sp.]|nr:acyltransferase 3 [Enterovirga sp.]
MDIVTYARFAAGGRRPAAPAASRVDWVDTAKGICIVFVVMMHATLGVEAAMGGQGFMHWAVAFAKPFRMPDFFLVSGLFLSRVIDRDWRSYGDKRVVHFLYFYLLWLAIQSAFKYGQISGGSPLGFLQHLLVGLYEPYSTLWFIYILAIFSVVTKLLSRISNQVVLAAAAMLQILPIETGWFLLDEFCERWVFFLAGSMLAPQIFRLAGWARAHRRSGLGALLAWALVNGLLALTPTRFPGSPTAAELPLVGLLLGGAGALAIVALAALITPSRAAEPFRYAGEHSIAIYLAFFLPMAAARTVLIKTGIVTDIGTVAAIVTAAAVVAPLLVERAVRHTPLSFLFRRPAWARLRPARPALRLRPAG